ncbi:hypothetical protein GCM10028868_24180 [Virgibacillus kimchii]
MNPTLSRQIEPAKEVEKATPDKVNYVEKESEPLYNNHSNYILAKAEKHPRALRQAILKVIYDALAPFYDVDGLYKTYGNLLRTKAAIDSTITVEEYGDDYVDVFLNVLRLHKHGKVRKSFEGLLYTSWERLTAEVSRKVNVNRSHSSIGIFEECLTCF